MKKTKFILSFIALLLIGLLCFQACEKQDVNNFNGTFTLNLQQELVLAINDGRCPENANCVTAGKANVKVNFKSDQNDYIANFCLGDCEKAQHASIQHILINSVIYTAELTELTPYPNTTQNPIRQQINLKLTKN
jgi:hypothetical protein